MSTNQDPWIRQEDETNQANQKYFLDTKTKLKAYRKAASEEVDASSSGFDFTFNLKVKHSSQIDTKSIKT